MARTVRLKLSGTAETFLKAMEAEGLTERDVFAKALSILLDVRNTSRVALISEGHEDDDAVEFIYGINVSPGELHTSPKASTLDTVQADAGRARGTARAAAGAAGRDRMTADEETEFNVVLLDSGDNKISVIKAVRDVTNLGLREAKDMVEAAAPSVVKTGVSREEAESISTKLEQAGATVEVESP